MFFKTSSLLLLLGLFFLEAPSALAQTLDTSTQETYSQSLINMYDGLPEDERIEFEAFFFSLVFDGKVLPVAAKLNDFDNLEILFDLIKKLEAAETLNINGLDAKSIVREGRSALKRYLSGLIANSNDEKEKQRLEKQLEIINREPLSLKDISAYNRLRK